MLRRAIQLLFGVGLTIAGLGGGCFILFCLYLDRVMVGWQWRSSESLAMMWGFSLLCITGCVLAVWIGIRIVVAAINNTDV